MWISLPTIKFCRFESEFVGTNMYLTISGDEALIVDPHFDKQADDLLKERSVRKITVFLTHEHPDHTHGLPWLKENFDTAVICQEQCAASIGVEKNNRPYLITFVLSQRDKENGTYLLDKFKRTVRPYAFKADKTFDKELDYNWIGHRFHFRHTPGHSKGSCCITVNDAAVFTGDSLIFDTSVITRFPGGSKEDFETKTKPYLNTFADETIVLAGHGKTFKMKEARDVGF